MKSLGQVAYEAYFICRDGDTGYWDELKAEQRFCWEGAATAVQIQMILAPDSVEPS